VLNKLETMGVRDNTIVFFMSDNGASAEQIIRGGGHDPAAPVGSEKTFLGIGPGWSSVANTPFRLHKSWNHEGGITTPLIVNWPAGIKDQKGLRNDPGHLVDIVPTVLELTGGKQPEAVAGFKVPPLPGLSLVPDFIKDGTVKHEYLWWNHVGNRAIRMGDWKLVGIRNSQWELYDMSKDRSETKDLASEHPEKVKQLEMAWQQHANEFHALALQDLPAPGKAGKAGKNAGGENE
jgi:arylsulfatase